MAETVNDYTETDLGNVAPNPQGDYSETGEYEYLDLVAYAGGSYMCILAEGTVTGTAPTPGKTTEIWQEVSRPGNLTPEYVALHDDVVNKAASVAEDAASVAADRVQVEGMKENVAALQEQTAQDAQLAKEYRESAAGYASAAETSRTAAGESEENIRALVNGFDAHVEEQKTAAQEDITTSRQAAIKAIAAQQVSSVNTVKQEGQKAINKTNADAEATAADRAAVSEKAATVDGQAAQVAQNAAQVAEDKATAENYMQTAGESKKQALEAAERLKDSVNLVQKNTVDLQGKAHAIIGSATSYDGTPVEVNDSAEMPLQGLNVYGKSKQVTTTGANLFDANDVSKGYISDDSGNNIVVTNSYCSNFITVSAKTKYYLYSGQDGGRWGAFYDSSKTFILGIGPDKYNTVFETPENAAYVRFTVNYNNNNPDFARNVIFAKSTVALPFEPYTGGKPSPSPDYPQEIVSVGQKLSTGKNLINADGYYSKFKQSDGTYKGENTVINKIAIPLAHFVGKKIVVSANIDFPSTIDTMQIRAAIGENNYYGDIVYPNTNKRSVLTVTVQTQNDNFWFAYGSGSGQVIISDIQVELGSTVTSYEPYTGGVPALYQKNVKVELIGKNLFGGKAFADEIVEIGGSLDETNKTVTISAGKLEGKNIYEFPDKTKQYTVMLSGHNLSSAQSANLRIVYEDNSHVDFLFVNGKMLFVTDKNKKPKKIIGIYYTGTTVFDYEKFGIFEGVLTETDFKSYEHQSFPIATPTGLPAIPVPSGASGITYTDADGQAWIADEIDFGRGKYVQRVWKGVFDGSEDEVWTYNIGAHRANIILNNGNLGTYDQRGIASMCSNLLWNRNVYSDSNRENGYLINNNTFFVRVAESLALNTEPDFRTWLASNPITLQYVLATPIETDLSEAQIQAYKSLTTFKPTSIISNDANAQMEVEYACDTKTYIDNKLQEIAQALVASASEAE